MSDSLRPCRLQHARYLCSQLSPRVCSNSCPLGWSCYLTVWSSAAHFSFCLQSFPASGSFLINQLFASGGQSIGASASASVLPVNIQGWFPLGLTGLISLLSEGLSREVFSSTTVQASSDNHFAFLCFFFLGIALITASCTVLRVSVHCSSGAVYQN